MIYIYILLIIQKDRQIILIKKENFIYHTLKLNSLYLNTYTYVQIETLILKEQMEKYIDRQIDNYIDRFIENIQIDLQTNIQTDLQTKIQPDREIDKYTDR